MSLLVSVSGAQSTGKTTLLEGVNSTLQFPVDEFKVARAVLEEFGEGLYDILKSEAKTIKFQEEILKQKTEHDGKLKGELDEFIFVERCPADLFAFAYTWREHFKKPSYLSWLNHYRVKCEQAMKIYDISILIHPGAFSHSDDGVRAKADTQQEVDTALSGFLARHWMDINFAKPRFHLHQMYVGGINERLAEVKSALNDGKKYLNYYENLFKGLSSPANV